MLRVAFVWIGVSVLAAATAGKADEEAVRVFEQIQDSVVELRDVMGGGTGIILNQEGLVLTNAHVVASPLQMQCTASVEINSRRRDVSFENVEVLGVHPKKDLAVVKFDPGPHSAKLKPARISTRKSPPGQRIYAIGNPASGSDDVQLSKTITEGLLSGVDRVIEGVSYYQISAPVNPGNSGGPLVDSSGIVLGLVTLKFTDVENVGFAIPLNDIDLSEFVPMESRAVDKEKADAMIAFSNQMVHKYAILQQQGQADAPVAEFLKALATQGFLEALLNDPTNPTTYRALGVMMAEHGQNDAADALFKHALEMMPWGNDSQHYRQYGNHLAQTDRAKEAKIVWLEGVAKFPVEGALMWEDLAIYYRNEGDYTESGQCAANALYLFVSHKARIRGNVVKAIYDLCLSKLPSPQSQQALRNYANAVPQELQKLAQRAEQDRKRNTLAIRQDFKRFLSEQDIRLSKRKPRKTTVALNNRMLPPQVDPEARPSQQVEGLDLLAGVDVTRHAIKGLWLNDGGKLASTVSPCARILIPAELPQEYELAMDVTRLDGAGELAVGFVREGTQSVFLIDAGGTRSGLCGLASGVHSGPVLPRDETVHVLIYVRREGLAIEANGQQIFLQKTDDDFPPTPAAWQVRDPFQLFLGSNDSSFRVDVLRMRQSR